MTCDAVTNLIPLYYYGELTPDEEDQLDQHLHECAACSAADGAAAHTGGGAGPAQLEIPAPLLDECRGRSDGRNCRGRAAPGAAMPRAHGALFLEAMGATFAGFGRLRQPVTAVLPDPAGIYGRALFYGATAPTLSPVSSGDVYPTVRSVKAGNDGNVRIQLDETRRRR